MSDNGSLATISDIQDQIVDDLTSLDNWFDKYEYLIEQGKELTPLKEELRTEDNIISGCQSSVWLTSEVCDGKLCYRADSEAAITKGMLALLLKVLNNQEPAEIVAAELYFLENAGISSHLSPSRADGLAAIIDRMKFEAQQRLPSNQASVRGSFDSKENPASL